MTPTDAEKISEVLIVAAGAVLTLVLGGALLYWMDQEWRGPDVQKHGSRGPHDPPVQRPPEA